MEKIVEKMLDFAAVMWYNIRGYLFFFFYGKFCEKFHNFVAAFYLTNICACGILFFNCEKFHEEKFWGK